MGIFSKKSSSGGLMNVIRCDEKEYSNLKGIKI